MRSRNDTGDEHPETEDAGTAMANVRLHPGAVREAPPLATFQRRWKAALLVMAIVAGNVAVYAWTRPATYRSVAVVAVVPRSDTTSADIARLAASRNIAYANASATRVVVSRRAGEPVSQLAHHLTAAVEPDTANLELRADAPTAALAARRARTFTDVVLAYAASDHLVTTQLVAPASAATSSRGASRGLYLVLGVCGGLLLGLAVSSGLDHLGLLGGAGQRQPGVLSFTPTPSKSR